MKKLLSLMFASLVVFSLTMPAVASTTPGTTPAAKTAKAHKAKVSKNHKVAKATNKVPAKAN